VPANSRSKPAEARDPLNEVGAWHSALMEPAQIEFAKHIADAPLTMAALQRHFKTSTRSPYTSVAQIKAT